MYLGLLECVVFLSSVYLSIEFKYSLIYIFYVSIILKKVSVHFPPSSAHLILKELLAFLVVYFPLDVTSFAIFPLCRGFSVSISV